MHLLPPIPHLDEHLGATRLLGTLCMAIGAVFSMAFPLVILLRIISGSDPGLGVTLMGSTISLVGASCILMARRQWDHELDRKELAATWAKLQVDDEVLDNLEFLYQCQGERLLQSQVRELELWLETRETLRSRGKVSFHRRASHGAIPVGQEG